MVPIDNPGLDKGASPPAMLTNSLGMKLVLLRAGKFRMGTPENEDQREKHEGPTVEVHAVGPFYMGIFEVTVGEFRAFVKDTGYVTEAEVNHAGSYNQIISALDPAPFGTAPDSLKARIPR